MKKIRKNDGVEVMPNENGSVQFGQEELKKKLELPQEREDNIRAQSEKLDKVINEYGEEYLGTDPVEDAKRIYREKKKKQYGINDDDPKNLIQITGLMKDVKKTNPFNNFGHGINAYLTLITLLFWTFIAISVIQLPVFYIYNNAGHYKEGYDKYMILRTTQGNLGYKATTCYHQYFSKEKNFSQKIQIKCNTGKIS